MDFTVVVNTLNRHDTIAQCLWSLRQQEGIAAEVVVVDGSTSDETQILVASHFPEMRYLRISSQNLSLSRNVGISRARGEYVAFIDDDAFAHPLWLARLKQAYARERSVGAVGGFTRAAKRSGWQVRGTLCDRWGDSYATEVSQLDDFCFPGSPIYPSLLGTNSSFRRSALEEIGGFDEAYAYFLDETDVCLRVVDAGYRVRYEPSATVFHEMHRSDLRSPSHYPKSLAKPSRSKSYFIYKHGREAFGAEAAGTQLATYVNEVETSNAWFLTEGLISESHYARLTTELRTGVREGVALASDSLHLDRGLANPILQDLTESTAVHGFEHNAGDPTHNAGDPAAGRVALICRAFPPDSFGGIAKWYFDLAAQLANEGMEIHVFTENVHRSGIKLLAPRLWVHFVDQTEYDELTRDARRLVDMPEDQLRWSFAAAMAATGSGFDFTAGLAPIWDAEGLGMELLCDWPSVITLHTTHALAKPWKPDWNRPAYSLAHVYRMEQAERLSLILATRVIANSNFAANAVATTYGDEFLGRCVTIPHAVRAGTGPVTEGKWGDWGKAPIKVLFLGRAEKRKGFPEAADAALSLSGGGQVQFDFIGQAASDEESRSALDRLLGATAPGIRVHGPQTSEAVERALRQAHVVLMPSRFESFGLVAAEAIAEGCLVVIPRDSAMYETFGDFPSVAAFDVVTVDELSRVIRDLVALIPDPEGAVAESHRRLTHEFNFDKVGRAVADQLSFEEVSG